MIIDIMPAIDSEIGSLMNKLSENDRNFRTTDSHYMEVATPFLINPDSRNEEWKNKMGVVFYPKLLSYLDSYIERGDPEKDPVGSRNYKSKNVTVPWICVRVCFESEVQEREILKWLVSKFKEIEYPPFMDEDATFNHFRKTERRGFNDFEMYVNPSYPEGMWENHTL